ncbi:ABC transporter ATP-binding protein [Streptomyces sp. 35G-GA-8]|uniref:ABC transporter ATP-binding protein n=1 Tax=Streptomyces sp. 35G-GA-8 TaxID=2939434 RepID=UPI00201F9D94|nr:ABC transporter ATP-binding protein [Streptomyces sp. 35G-GA-8]MCL7375707.1 ABC transporter ATP-binding protein/permease [Streptomyces sp. 35G-GA-8]
MSTGRTSATPAHHLPVAEPSHVRRAAIELIRRDGRAFAAAITLNALAAAVGLVGPWLLGRIINTVRAGGGVSAVDRYALVILGCALAQLLLARYARLIGHRFGERTSARIRERLVGRALALPASTVERAGTGDLTTRGTTDVTAVGTSLRDAGPDVFIAGVQALFILGAVFVLDPLLGACGLLGLLGIRVVTRWYLRHAGTDYLAEGEANSVLAEVLSSTASAARTVEAFGLQERRVAASEAAIEECLRTRNRTLFLRSVLFPAVEIGYVVPVVAILLVGYALTGDGLVSLGTVVACALYLRQLAQPLDTILQWVEQLQSSGASFARIEGLAGADTDTDSDARTDADPGTSRTRTPARPAPDGDLIEVTGVRFAYDGGRDVLHGVDLTVRPGERLAIVGRSGAGKSTLGRLLAGIDRPRTGSVTVGGVPVAALDPVELRRHVVLVTQEHHVFIDSVRDNLLIAAPTATDERIRAALHAVGADWVDDLPDGLDTELGAGVLGVPAGSSGAASEGASGSGSGSGGAPGEIAIDGARSQQLALARVVLADPHTVILDEATALLDPTTARHAERALAAVLEGRTVIAIAHRLHTARDADRVAVMDGGLLTELGTHEALVSEGGAYAGLWHSWHGDTPAAPSGP